MLARRRPPDDVTWLQGGPRRSDAWLRNRVAVHGSVIWVHGVLGWTWRRVDLSDLRSVRRGEYRGSWWTFRDHCGGRITLEAADAYCEPLCDLIRPVLEAATQNPDIHTGHSVRAHLDVWGLPGEKRRLGRTARPPLEFAIRFAKPPRPLTEGEHETHRLRQRIERELGPGSSG